jgi:hypothetical protein
MYLSYFLSNCNKSMIKAAIVEIGQYEYYLGKMRIIGIKQKEGITKWQFPLLIGLQILIFIEKQFSSNIITADSR